MENTVNWYFSSENLNRANDRVLELTEQLDLPKVYKKELDKTHTSSDGQKFSISVDSLNANYSYKYFGQGKGVSVYSFIDESHRLFYSTVINVSEREAAYVIDGLMYNDVVQSDIHSTDTHGYSEMFFGVTHLLGISFAPRIKDVKDQRLYSFESRSKLKELGYQILPDGRVNTKIIRDNWDDFLRFVTTIKLKETPASQLFFRLSSYSRQHPLYRASKEFGKIPKTLFLLRCIDDVILVLRKKQPGIGEGAGVDLASEYGLFTVCSAWDGHCESTGNLSVHSGTRATFQQKKAPSMPRKKENKVYYAFVRTDL